MTNAVEQKRVRNAMRYKWLELLTSDPGLNNHAIAVKLAAHIMSRYTWKTNVAMVSMNAAAKACGTDTRTVMRARDKLIERCWIRLAQPYSLDAADGGWSANTYSLSGGPDDYDLAMHIRLDATDG